MVWAGKPSRRRAVDSAKAESSPAPHDGGSPPERVLEVLDLLERKRVKPARQVLPAVVGDDEHHVPLIELTGDPDGNARDRAGGHTGEDALLFEQPTRPSDRVAVGHEDLAVEHAEIDDRRYEAVVQRAQALHRLTLHRFGGDDLDGAAERLLQPSPVAHQRPAG